MLVYIPDIEKSDPGPVRQGFGQSSHADPNRLNKEYQIFDFDMVFTTQCKKYWKLDEVEDM